MVIIRNIRWTDQWLFYILPLRDEGERLSSENPKREMEKTMSSLKEIGFRQSTSGAMAEGRFVSGFFLALRAASAQTVKALLNRLQAHDLRDFDDRLLDDIGLTRLDLEQALAQTRAFEDPTPALSRAARTRAVGRFASRRG